MPLPRRHRAQAPRHVLRPLHRTFALIPALGLALTLAACGGNDSSSASSEGDAGLQTVSSGTLTVCSDVPYPPFEDVDEASESGF